jgi:hypothetical protein
VRECTYISAVKSEGNSGFEKKGPPGEDFTLPVAKKDEKVRGRGHEPRASHVSPACPQR